MHPSRDAIPLIVFRDVLGVRSETFIPAQVEAFTRFRGYYTGSFIARGHPLPEELVVPSGAHGGLSTARRAMFRYGGVVPWGWLDRLADVRPRLVHAHFGPDAALAVPIARQLGIPLIATFHGHDISVQPERSLAYRYYRTVLLPRVFRNAARIIAVSDHIKRLLLDAGAPADRVVRHYIGIDVRRFAPPPSPVREPFVLFIGRFVEKKGAGYLIRAMREVQRSRNVELVLAGDGPLRRELENLAAGLKVRCRFLGAVDQASVASLMRTATLLVVPSVTASDGDTEGLPITLLEGQSCGLPVVATRHAGIPEAVIDGVTGLLVRERDSSELADAISVIVGDPRRAAAMGDAARSLMVEHFDVARRSQSLEDLYDELLSARSPSSSSTTFATS